jgi:hypothetical protein
MAAESFCDPTSGKCIACSCSSEECCDVGGVCVASGAACSTGQACLLGEACQGLGSGPPCGVTGKPCCGGTGGTCTDGSLCKAAVCTACGTSGDPCCVDAEGKKACERGLVCNNAGTSCVDCGGTNQPCCAGDTCTAGGCNRTSNLCDVTLGCGSGCGGLGQPCCGSNTCSPGMCCDTTGTSAAVCVAAATKCANGYVCANNACECGASGQPCCKTAPTCDFDGGVCTSGTCG